MKKTTLALTVLVSLGLVACSSSETKYTTDTAAIASANVRANTAETKVADLTTLLATETANVNTLSAQLTEANSTVEYLTAQLAQVSQSSTNAVNSEALSTLQAELKSAQDNVATLTSSLSEATSKLQSLGTELSEANVSLTSAQNAQKTAEEALANAQITLAQAQMEAVQLGVKIANQNRAIAKAVSNETQNVIVRANSATSYHLANNTSEIYKALSSAENYAELVQKAKNAEDFYASCATSTNKEVVSYGCHKGIETGTVLKSYKMSYAGYGALRENYETNNEVGQPLNSFFTYVDVPTTDKSKVSGNYSGSASLSRNNTLAMNTYNVDLAVADEVIAGTVTNNGKEFLKFNEAQIVSDGASVTFAGQMLATNWDNAEGVWQGQFAGENAEQVVGTFETLNQDKSSGTVIQGAFGATRTE